MMRVLQCMYDMRLKTNKISAVSTFHVETILFVLLFLDSISRKNIVIFHSLLVETQSLINTKYQNKGSVSASMEKFWLVGTKKQDKNVL